MTRSILPLLFILLFATACDGLEKIEETDDFGTRTEYKADPETGLKEGPLRQYNKDGQLIAEENYVGGELNGERKLYFPDGKLAVQENYDMGTFAGEYKNYSEDGKLSHKGNYINGAMNEEWIAYYPDGKIKEIVNFENNEENGPFREWYPDGTPKASGNYLKGDKEHGVLHLYEEDGSLKKVMNCAAGMCTTIWTPDSTGVAPPEVDMTMPES